MKYSSSLELLVPTVQYGNAKLVANIEAEHSEFPKTLSEKEIQELLNQSVLNSVLAQKKELDKLRASSFSFI